MSKPSEVIDKLIEQLKADDDLSAMNINYFKGVRERIVSFPAIVVELLSLTESDSDDVGAFIDQEIQLAVIGYKSISNPEAQISEIMDFSNAIKKAIESDYTLGGMAIDVNLPEEHHEFINFPLRSIALAVNIKSRVTRAVRT